MAKSHDDWFNSGNPLDQEDPPIDYSQKVSDVLRDIASEVKDDPTAWTQGAVARDKDGNACSSFSKEAVCWCIYGFLRREFETNCNDQMLLAATALKDVVGGSTLETDLDDTTIINDSLKTPEEFINWVTKAADSLDQT